MSTENPVSPKVVAASAGAGAGAALSSLVLWILGVWFWKQPGTAAGAAAAIASVPAPIATVITLVMGVVTAALSGWKVTDPNRVTTTELNQVKENRRRR